MRRGHAHIHRTVAACALAGACAAPTWAADCVSGEFVTSFSCTVPAGVTAMKIEVWGGGGGGGGVGNGGNDGHAGGGGAYCMRNVAGLAAGQVLQINTGLGGRHGTALAGGAAWGNSVGGGDGGTSNGGGGGGGGGYSWVTGPTFTDVSAPGGGGGGGEPLDSTHGGGPGQGGGSITMGAGGHGGAGGAGSAAGLGGGGGGGGGSGITAGGAGGAGGANGGAGATDGSNGNPGLGAGVLATTCSGTFIPGANGASGPGAAGGASGGAAVLPAPAGTPGKGGDVGQNGAYGRVRLTFTLPPLPASIPTLSEWAMLGLSMLLAALAFARLRRR